VKFSDDLDNIALEIKVLQKISNLAKKNKQLSCTGFPPLIGHGLMMGINIDPDDDSYKP